MTVAGLCENGRMKACTKCLVTQDESAFYRSNRWPNGRQQPCKRCKFQDRRERYYISCKCGKPMRETSALCRTCSNTGSNSPRWRGGKTTDAKGYVRIKSPGHPRARLYPGAAGNYVLEHILVMESVLGRHLAPGETIHHRNGVRSDNRPENLELWTTPQRPNIRASDAVAWAKEVLRRYEPEALK